MDRSTHLYREAAQSLGFSVYNLPRIGGFKVTVNKKEYCFRGGLPPINDACSCGVIDRKHISNLLLKEKGYPVSRSWEITLDAYREAGFEFDYDALEYPVVIKASEGQDFIAEVICNVSEPEYVKKFVDNNISDYGNIVIEEFHRNLDSYRVLILDRKIIGLAKCEQVKVLGDGKHSIKELIERENIIREKSDANLPIVTIDDETLFRLKDEQRRVDDIPFENEVVFLSYKSRFANGSCVETIDINKLCNGTANLLQNAVKETSIRMVEVDLLCNNISEPITLDNPGIVNGLNYRPDIYIYDKPTKGMPQGVAEKVVRFVVRENKLNLLKYWLRKYVFRSFNNGGQLIAIAVKIVIAASATFGLINLYISAG